MDEIHNDIAAARQRRLQRDLVQAALDLLAYTQTSAVMATIEGTTPPLLIVVGDAAAIRALMLDA